MNVKPKKHLGQHFLKDLETCEKIAKQVTFHRGCRRVLEVGPGMGALTDYLITQEGIELYLVDIDAESIEYLHHKYPMMGDRIIYADFLRKDLTEIMGQDPFIVAGNFPYNLPNFI
jgi:16S rRNA (adenine1518-N6/adenine1519-N6)-dimethyltransferase